MRETSSGLPVGDIAAVREIASRVAEIAALPVQQERIREWRGLNALHPERPMAMIDEIPWHELASPGVLGAHELAVTSTHPFTRDLETRLRRELYCWDHMRVDMVVRSHVDFERVVTHDGYGIGITEEVIDGGDGNVIVSHHYQDQLAEDADVARLRPPTIAVDLEATAGVEAMARECIDGILQVRMQGWNSVDFAFGLWDDIEQLRGTEPILFDFLDRPEHLHAIAERFTQVRLAELDALEAAGALYHDLDRIHCTGSDTTELPATGHDPARPRAIDNWVPGRAQLFVSVSDVTFREFVVPYYARYYARWGLGYFGCCEPLHSRIDFIREIPNVRKISISPWARLAQSAESIGPDFVFSRKPNPAMVAMDDWVPQMAVRDFEETLAVTRPNGCPVEFTLKDISTCRRDPRRLWEWSEIASRMVRA